VFLQDGQMRTAFWRGHPNDVLALKILERRSSLHGITIGGITSK